MHIHVYIIIIINPPTKHLVAIFLKHYHWMYVKDYATWALEVCSAETINRLFDYSIVMTLFDSLMHYPIIRYRSSKL